MIPSNIWKWQERSNTHSRGWRGWNRYRQCIDKENSFPDVIVERDKVLSSLREAASSPHLKKRTKELRSRGGTSSKKLGERLNLGLMEWVQNQCQVEDKAIPLLCSVGMPILGPALESPFFLKFEELHSKVQKKRSGQKDWVYGKAGRGWDGESHLD